MLPAHTIKASPEGFTCLPAQLTALPLLLQWGCLLQLRARDNDQAWTEAAEWSLRAFPLNLQVVSDVHPNEETHSEELPIATRTMTSMGARVGILIGFQELPSLCISAVICCLPG